MKEFETESMRLKNTIDNNDKRQELRKKLMKFIEENQGMDEYLHFIRTNQDALKIFLGGALAVLFIEIGGFCIWLGATYL